MVHRNLAIMNDVEDCILDLEAKHLISKSRPITLRHRNLARMLCRDKKLQKLIRVDLRRTEKSLGDYLGKICTWGRIRQRQACEAKRRSDAAEHQAEEDGAGERNKDDKWLAEHLQYCEPFLCSSSSCQGQYRLPDAEDAAILQRQKKKNVFNSISAVLDIFHDLSIIVFGIPLMLLGFGCRGSKCEYVPTDSRKMAWTCNKCGRIETDFLILEEHERSCTWVRVTWFRDEYVDDEPYDSEQDWVRRRPQRVPVAVGDSEG